MNCSDYGLDNRIKIKEFAALSKIRPTDNKGLVKVKVINTDEYHKLFWR